MAIVQTTSSWYFTLIDGYVVNYKFLIFDLDDHGVNYTGVIFDLDSYAVNDMFMIFDLDDLWTTKSLI